MKDDFMKIKELNLLRNKGLMCLWDDVEDDFSAIGMKLNGLKRKDNNKNDFVSMR